MKIDSITPKELLGVYSKVKEKPVEKPKGTEAADRVELSEDAFAFSAAFKAAKEAMEQNDASRIKKVNEIKQRIDTNSYDVSGETIAEKLLDE